MDWQPIKTAPKDGTLILICEKRGRRQVARWSAPDGWHHGWYVSLTGSHSDSYPTTDVTHWMPLQEAPR